MFWKKKSESNIVLEEPSKPAPKPLEVFTYGNRQSLRRQVAPDFESDIIRVERDGDYITVYFDEGQIELPANQVIIVRRYE